MTEKYLPKRQVKKMSYNNKDKVKVDFIVGRRVVEMDSMVRYAVELYHNMKSLVDGQIIDYDPPPIPGANFVIRHSYYPLMIQRKRRKDGVCHLCSEGRSYWLNYPGLKNNVVTCHDIILYALFNQMPWPTRLRIAFWIKGLKKADRIIAISKYTKKDIVKYLGYPEERIHVVYYGVDHEKFHVISEAEVDSIVEKYNLPKDQRRILYVGSEQPWKNLPTLFRALGELKKKFRDFKLIKVGRPQNPTARAGLVALAKELTLDDNILYIDYMPEEDLPKIYNAADLFVFPSRYEGFGRPPLEAMACGIPVISSNASSLPEVVGDAALVVEPDNIAGFADAMYQVMTDHNLSGDMIKKGLQRAKKFTNERMAKETLKVYQELLVKP